jgi:hypothetical protein
MFTSSAAGQGQKGTIYPRGNERSYCSTLSVLQIAAIVHMNQNLGRAIVGLKFDFDL